MKLSMLSRFGMLPGPAKAMLTLSGASIGLIAFMALNMVMSGQFSFARLWPILKWVIIGLIVIGVILLIIELIRRSISKKKAASLEGSIEQNARAAPRSASAEDRQRLEAMRSQFVQGLETFRANGKNIYEVPWYLLVGAPGSGKSQALLNSGIDFPPGLNRPQQGVGGTINMDWWFTNESVILDTAGRILFEDVKAGESGEWDELLDQLRKFRGKRPINGVIVVLPAASSAEESDRNPPGLLEQTDADVEEHVTKFVDGLVRLRRKLKVKFPVFIVITKCDRLLGFEEFFWELSRREDQSQMLGWSNPAGLDEPYRGEMVDEAVHQIAERLRLMRMSLLRDPVDRIDEMSRRTDAIDGMYVLPDVLESLTPNLRRYLDRLFTKSAWYDPPFLRGIYFTSSLQEGSAVDMALADRLGVSPKDVKLPTPVPQEKRSYFIKDALEKKVFVERGLVTDAVNVDKNRRKLRMLMWGGGLATAALLIATGVWGWLCQKNWNDRYLEPWRDAASVHFSQKSSEFKSETRVLADARDGSTYDRRPGMWGLSDDMNANVLQASLYGTTVGSTERAGFFCRLFGDGPGDAREAQWRLFSRVVAGPTAWRALDAIENNEATASTGTDADLEGTPAEALAELLRWATLAEGMTPSGVRPNADDETRPVRFDRIAAVIPLEETRDAWAEDVLRLRSGDEPVGYAGIFDALAQGDAGQQFLAYAMGLQPSEALKRQRVASFRAAIDAMVSQSAPTDASQETAFQTLEKLVTEVKEYTTQERTLWRMVGWSGDDSTFDDRGRDAWYDGELSEHSYADEKAKAWRKASLAAHEHAEAAATLYAALGVEGEDISTALKRLIAEERERRTARFDAFAAALPTAPVVDEEADADPGAERPWLHVLSEDVAAARQATIERLATIESEWDDLIERSMPTLLASSEDVEPAITRRAEAYVRASLSDEDGTDARTAWALLNRTYKDLRLWKLDAIINDATVGGASGGLVEEHVSQTLGKRSDDQVALEAARRSADLTGRLFVHRAIGVIERAPWPTADVLAEAYPSWDEDFKLDTMASIPYTAMSGKSVGSPEARRAVLTGMGLAAADSPRVVEDLFASAGRILNEGDASNGAASWARFWREPASDGRDSEFVVRLRDYGTDVLDRWRVALQTNMVVEPASMWRLPSKEWTVVARAVLDPPDGYTLISRRLEEVRLAAESVVAPIERHADRSDDEQLANRAREFRNAIEPLDGGASLAQQLEMCKNYIREIRQEGDAAEAGRRVVEDARETGWSGWLQSLSQHKDREFLLGHGYASGLFVQFINALASDAQGDVARQLEAGLDVFNGFPFTNRRMVQGGRFGDLQEAQIYSGGQIPEPHLDALEALADQASNNAGGDRKELVLDGLLRDDVASAINQLDANLNAEMNLARAERMKSLVGAICGTAPDGSLLMRFRNEFTVEAIEARGTNATYATLVRSGDDDADLRPIRIGSDFELRERSGDVIRLNVDDAFALEFSSDDWLGRNLNRAGARVGNTIDLKRWGALQLICAYGQPDQADPKTWLVRLPVAGGGEVTLRLKFERGIPPVKDWP